MLICQGMHIMVCLSHPVIHRLRYNPHMVAADRPFILQEAASLAAQKAPASISWPDITVKEASDRRRHIRAASNARLEFISASCTCMHLLAVISYRPAALPLQEALDSSKQERESSDAEWDARHQEAVDSAEQWKAFADKLTKEKEEQQEQLTSASAELQVELMRLLLHVECLRHLISFSFFTLQSGMWSHL